MVRRLLPVVAVSLLLPAEALADQCAYVTPAQSRRAVEKLEVGQRYVHFCEPCDQLEPSSVAEIRQVTSENVDYADHRQVSINGEPIDLAYVFVETKPGRFENLAKLSRCEAHDVSRFVTIDEAIEPEPVDPAIGCSEPSIAELPVPLPRPHVYVDPPREASTPDPRWPTWLAFTFGGILLAPAWAAVWFGLWFARRRRTRST